MKASLLIAGSLVYIMAALAMPALGAMRGGRGGEWITEKWLGAERPYQVIRTEVEAARKDARRLDQLLRQARERASKQPQETTAQFAWAYSVYTTATLHPDAVPWRQELARCGTALEQVASPAKYEFARLRFLITAWLKPTTSLVPLGRRLLALDRSDRAVKYLLVQLLSWSSLADKKQGLLYAEQLLISKPDSAAYHSARGGALRELWWSTRELVYGREAVAAYRRYLQLAPRAAGFRAHAERLIRITEDELKVATVSKGPG